MHTFQLASMPSLTPIRACALARPFTLSRVRSRALPLAHIHTRILLRSPSRPFVRTRLPTLALARSRPRPLSCNHSLAHTAVHADTPARMPTYVTALVLACSDACTPVCLHLLTHAPTGWCGRSPKRACAHSCGPACLPASVLSCERARTRAPVPARLPTRRNTPLRPCTLPAFPTPDCQLHVRAHGGARVGASTQRFPPSRGHSCRGAFFRSGVCPEVCSGPTRLLGSRGAGEPRGRICIRGVRDAAPSLVDALGYDISGGKDSFETVRFVTAALAERIDTREACNSAGAADSAVNLCVVIVNLSVSQHGLVATAHLGRCGAAVIGFGGTERHPCGSSPSPVRRAGWVRPPRP